jgi:myo-inositol 2-dehydrogenase/D-chiro-inositol 1-dehydrogenase
LNQEAADGVGKSENASDGKLRAGFIGCGSHALMNLYPALMYAPVQLVSICDKDTERLETAQGHYAVEAAFDSMDSFFEGPPLDAVFVCGPPELHQAAAIRAMDRGLHTFVEKPPAPDLKGALEMQRAAEVNGVSCGVGFMKRFALRYVQAKQIMATEAFGKTTQVSIKYAHWNSPNLKWMLSYMTVHLFDLARFFAGDLERITIEVSETGGQHSFSVVGKSKSGILVTLITSSHEPRVKETVEIVGEGELISVRNVVDLEYHRHVEPGRIFDPELRDVDLLRPNFAIPNTMESTLFLQGYAGQLINFAESSLEGRAPSVTIADGVEAMRFADLFANGVSGTFRMGEGR